MLPSITETYCMDLMGTSFESGVYKCMLGDTRER